MRILLGMVLIFSFFPSAYSQAIYFHHALFRMPDGKPYLETYMAINGAYFPFTKNDNQQFFIRLPFRIFLKKNQEPEVLLKEYSLRSPDFTDTLKPPVFLDLQRYPLTAGSQQIFIHLLDPNSQKLLQTHTISLTIPARPDVFSISDLVWAEKLIKSSNTSHPYFKSGYELYPYPVNYFPEKINLMQFYAEAYNFSDTNDSLHVHLRIVDADAMVPVKGYSKIFRWKQKRLPLPIAGKFDISALVSGNYLLEMRILNSSDSVISTRSFFFQRKNFFSKKMPADFFTQGMTLEKYIRSLHNPDTLFMHIECLYPISSEIEKERQYNHLKNRDTALMKNYLIHFWQKKANDTVNPYALCNRYMKMVYEANARFRCGKQKGYNTEQGRVFLQYGRPSQLAAMYNEANTFPYEIWHYYRSYDQSEHRFVTNRKFIFVNQNLADNCFRLIHSDMRGEINNERWRYDIMKRFNNGLQNDSNIPVESQNSQMNDLFQTPR